MARDLFSVSLHKYYLLGYRKKYIYNPAHIHTGGQTKYMIITRTQSQQISSIFFGRFPRTGIVFISKCVLNHVSKFRSELQNLSGASGIREFTASSPAQLVPLLQLMGSAVVCTKQKHLSPVVVAVVVTSGSHWK